MWRLLLHHISTLPSTMKFPSCSISTCLIILFATTAYQSLPLRAQPSAGRSLKRWFLSWDTDELLESFIENSEEFIPSHEWQSVKDGNVLRHFSSSQLRLFTFFSAGQAIPPGLHIRLNLQTGAREAKLLEDAPAQKGERALVAVDQPPSEARSQENLQRAFAKLNLSADDVQTSEVRSVVGQRNWSLNWFFCLGTCRRSASKISFVRWIEEGIRLDANEDWNRSRNCHPSSRSIGQDTRCSVVENDSDRFRVLSPSGSRQSLNMFRGLSFVF